MIRSIYKVYGQYYIAVKPPSKKKQDTCKNCYFLDKQSKCPHQVLLASAIDNRLCKRYHLPYGYHFEPAHPINILLEKVKDGKKN